MLELYGYCLYSIFFSNLGRLVILQLSVKLYITWSAGRGEYLLRFMFCIFLFSHYSKKFVCLISWISILFFQLLQLSVLYKLFFLLPHISLLCLQLPMYFLQTLMSLVELIFAFKTNLAVLHEPLHSLISLSRIMMIWSCPPIQTPACFTVGQILTILNRDYISGCIICMMSPKGLQDMDHRAGNPVSVSSWAHITLQSCYSVREPDALSQFFPNSL